ncbi:RNA polymerase subunit sigma-24 [Aeoliella sp. ICT_H6.2]|uniref:RNA polymerase subunit sigma-24 n=1 Tax=Aeoliella straminimaris TaxID=2954799 RepID=A0A9X2FI57_9BACT|nr:RNA polymerase subunit sigma-24 [Aeoliella straminimaris]MCO6045616.1 RNA polymerase subunit sigma-24 [Aeoliella straminimaris]
MEDLKPMCQVTHGQIAGGTCPWCPAELSRRRAGSVAQGRSGKCRWDLDAMSAALDAEEHEVRSVTISNLMFDHGPSIEASLPLLSQALGDPSELNRHLVESALCKLGRGLSPGEVQPLEDGLGESPCEAATRILLLGYYFLGQRQSPAARESRLEHALWLIEHAPATKTAGSPEAYFLEREDAAAYLQASELWLDQVDKHPHHPAVLGNAASFFLLNDRQQSESLYQEAQRLDPENPAWSERLGQLYSLPTKGQDSPPEHRAGQALRAFRESESAREAEANNGNQQESQEARARRFVSRMHLLPQMAKAAVAAGELEQAERYATELLTLAEDEEFSPPERRDGNAIHYANLVLGQCALRAGDEEGAKQYLLASGRIKGSPNLCSFGPNMSLAKELLEHGEPTAVLEYFELCRGFWKSHEAQLDQWIEEVQRGEVPDFGANLSY